MQDKIAPRMIICDLATGTITRLPAITSTLVMEGAVEVPHRGEFNVDNETNGAVQEMDEECINRDWQMQNYIACNDVHDVDMMNLAIINCGSSRCAFRLEDLDQSYFVFKTQK